MPNETETGFNGTTKCLGAPGLKMLLGRGQGSFLLAVGFLYVATFVFVLPWLCRTWPYSSYFVRDASVEDTVRRALELNDARLSKARAYLDGLGGSLSGDRSVADTERGVELAVGVITVSRENSEIWNLGYLTQVTAQLHRLASQDTRFRNKTLFLCNVDFVPGQHSEALRMSRFVNMVARFEGASEDQTNDDEGTDPFDKEKEDYVFCLRQAARYKPEFVLLLEDDALPTEGFFSTLHYLLHQRILRKGVGRETPAGTAQDWILLKLYHPERWLGYSTTFAHVAELAGFGCLGWTLFVLIGQLAMRPRPRGISRVMLGVPGALYVVYLVHSVGRPYVMELWSHSPYTHRLVAAPGCCTPGMLYSARMADVSAEFLTSIRCHINFALDMALDWMAQNYHYQRYLVEPNLVKHIGMWSSLRTYAQAAAEFA